MTQTNSNRGIRTLADISSLLGVEMHVLNELAGKLSTHVRVSKVKIKEKPRTLIEALPPLNLIQKTLNKSLLSKLPTPRSMHGYKQGRSNVTHAASHVRAPVILRYDLADFFPSIRYPRVFKFFQSLGANSDAANILTRLTTFRGSLPLGFPTSPAIANQVASRLVRRLEGVAKKNALTFTAYADNFEISGPTASARFDKLIRRIIVQEGFKVNEKKSQPLQGSVRKELTGVVVNDKTSWGRDRIRGMRARIRRIQIEGLPANPGDQEKLLFELRGYRAYVASINPAQGDILCGLISRLQGLRINKTNMEPTLDGAD